MKNNKYPKLHNFNDMYTPPEAMSYITPFLNKNLTYWEACYGMGHMADELTRQGFKVVGNNTIDCLDSEPEESWDIWITNPPFNGNRKFINRAIELGKPFVFLIRLEHLGGVEVLSLLKDLDFKVIIPERRINYIRENQKQPGAPFHSIWLTYKIDLPKQINYVKTTP